MPASFELEAIKAQVVASRTFVYSRLLSVDNTTNTQVYLDDEKMKVSWNEHYEEYKEKVKKAIKETKGEIITYQGECISALFSYDLGTAAFAESALRCSVSCSSLGSGR